MIIRIDSIMTKLLKKDFNIFWVSIIPVAYVKNINLEVGMFPESSIRDLTVKQ